MTLPNTKNGLQCSKWQNISHKSRFACDNNLNQHRRSGRPGHAGLNSTADRSGPTED